MNLSTRLIAAFDTMDIVHPEPDALPADMDSAIRIQDAAMAGIGPIVAWKLGATIPAVRAALELPHAFFAGLPARRVFQDGAALNPVVARQRGLECEYGFRLARDVTAADLDRDVKKFAELIDTVHPAIEIPGTRFAALAKHGGFGLVADFGAAGALVIGAGQPLGDPRRLDDATVQLRINGAEAVTGAAAVIEAGAFGPVPDFMRAALSRGYHLRAGQVIVTGSCTGYVTAPEGAMVEARFAALDASVSLRFDAALQDIEN